MKNIKLLNSVLILIYLIFSIIRESEGQSDVGTEEITTTAATLSSTESATSPSSPKASVKITDFVRFDQVLHEAEFIFQYTTTSSENASELNVLLYRSLTPLSITKISQNIVTARYKVTVKCKTVFALYPHDVHLCGLQFLLKGNTSVWDKELVPLCGELGSYDFKTKGYFPLQLPGGAFHVSLLLERTSGMQIFSQMYSPVIMLVSLTFFTLSKKGSFTFRIWTSIACILALFIVTSILWQDIPRSGESGKQTAIEHYIIFCIGFAFQNVFTNILIYAYLSKTKVNKDSDEAEVVEDAEANNGAQNGGTKKAKTSTKIKPIEMHILKMGKFHQFFYFKCLKPAKYQLPIAFLIFNIIYWIIIVWLTTGLPKGFLEPPKFITSSPLDYSCF